MNKSFSFSHVFALLCFAVATSVSLTIMCIQGFLLINNMNTSKLYTAKLNEIQALVDEYYIGDVDQKLLIDGLSAGYVMGLGDAYSNYVTAEDAEESFNSFYGVNTGMGVQVSMHPDSKGIFVLDVHSGSPAETSGLTRGDTIIKIDGYTVSEIGYNNALLYIKYKPIGSTIHLIVERKGETVEFDGVLEHYTSQTVFSRLLGDIGYIQITGFNDASVEQFSDAVSGLLKDGAKALIFDLRGNGGGTLNSAYQMVDILVPEGLIVRVEYKDSDNNQIYYSDSNEIDLPMVVLTDDNTASASELFAQALKDHKKAITVGRKTYGKAVVQRTFTLSDNSLVKFTVAKYYTANGTCLDGVGVIPDIPIEWEQDELTYRLVNGIEVDKEFLAAVQYLDKLI